MRHSPVNRRGGKTAVETTGGNANTFSAAKQRFLNIVAHCGLNGLSILRTLLLTVHNLNFLYSFTCFFYALEQHALPVSPQQYFTLVSWSMAKSLLLYKDLPIYLEELPQHSSVLIQSTRLKGSHFPLLHQTGPELS